MKMRLFTTIIATFYLTFQIAAQVKIQSGPMLGYSTLNEVGIWLQLTDSASVSIEYWEADKEFIKKKLRPSFLEMDETHIAKFAVSELIPGTDYKYEISVNGDIQSTDSVLSFSTQVLWQFRTDPPTTRIAIGSCTYINEASYDRPGKAYGSNYKILESIADKNPDAMIWLGDNIYLREYDYFTWKGYLHRYNHTRSNREMQRLLRTTNNYAIWDDHDFGPNDANGSWIHKDWALDAFKLFWMNPSYGIAGVPGITTAFPINDIHFFFLDNRYNRTSPDNKGVEPQILGKDQIEWLIEALKFSNAPFKMIAIGGQVLNPAKVYENYAQYPEERKYLIERIVEEKIEGVIFLTGDRHHTELRKIDVDGIVIHDLTVSPLTSGVHSVTNEANENLISGTMISEHNFAVLEFTGERLSRQLKISIFDKEGSELWSRAVNAK